MTRVRRVVGVIGLAVCVITFAVAGRAQAPAAAHVTGAEQEALDLFRANKLINARTKAEEVLRANPNSIVGHYVLGSVLYEAEGSLSKAMHHLGRARELYETRWSPSTRSEGAPWELHRDTLFAVQNVAGQMGLDEYQLDVLGYHDFLYDPDLLAERVWPLMRLGRFDEARVFAGKAIAAHDALQRSLGFNALCAVEGEAHERRPYYDACMAAFRDAESRRAAGADVQVAVHAYNAALGALAIGRPDEAEKALAEGARRLEFTTANPWRLLLRIYLDEGRMADAVQALREMQRWRKRQPAYLRDQDRAETDVAFATLLLVAGETEMALRSVDRAIEQPDRRGLTSSNAEQALGAHALLRLALVRTEHERKRETAAARGFWANWVSRVGGWFSFVDTYPDKERIRSAMADAERLKSTLRVHVRGGIEPVPVWLLGDLVDVLGPGVVAESLRRARRDDGPGSPYLAEYDAIEAEVALARGDEVRAMALADSAMKRLPRTEALLRARTLAVRARAAEALGKRATAVENWAEALGIDGGVVRRMGVSIPARVDAGTSAMEQRAGAALERSPRFRDEPGFTVLVRTQGKRGLRGCLLNERREQLRCVDVERRPAKVQSGAASTVAATGTNTLASNASTALEDEESFIVRFASEFQRRAFAADVSFSSVDLGSLDGRVSAGSEVERERMESMLHQLMNEASPPSPPTP